ncbi:MAG: group I intron-associated PD-(D/E)XK endonuclease [Candidatus Sulfotelmatobacter sp.]
MKSICKFRTFKQRGEWVELKFMAKAAENGLQVLKPWGDSMAYDVGLDLDRGNDQSHHARRGLVRVQVKSTSVHTQFGYLCQFKPGPHSPEYTLRQVDFFAAYVIPEDVWYLIPAAVLISHKQKAVTLLPTRPKHPDRYRYEIYKEAWPLLRKKDQLGACPRPASSAKSGRK